MSDGAATARRLLERTGSHPVISLYFDLDPERFATAPARASQARALIDQARGLAHELEDADALSHDERVMLTEGLERLDEYLGSDDLPVSGARALAIFSSPQDELFETVVLSEPVAPSVFVDRTPHVEPLLAARDERPWCVVIVSSRDGEVYLGRGGEITDHQSIADYVRGRGDAGATGRNTEEQDIEGHLIQVADAIYRDWQRRPFEVLALAGPSEWTSRLRALLHNDLRPALTDATLSLDESAATDATVRDAVADMLSAQRDQRAREALDQLGDTTRVALGLDDTLQALTERRVQTLLLSRDFSARGGRCPNDGMLVPEGVSECPADGAAVEPVADLREAAVQAALGQDAEVIAFDQPQDALPAAHPFAALLRF